MLVSQNKPSLWIASFIEDVEDDNGNLTSAYADPVEIKNPLLNSLSGYYDAVAFGDKVNNMSRIMLNYSQWFGKIKERDLAYLYGANPEGEKNNGDNANYRVVAVRPQNIKIAVYFEKLIGKG